MLMVMLVLVARVFSMCFRIMLVVMLVLLAHGATKTATLATGFMDEMAGMSTSSSALHVCLS